MKQLDGKSSENTLGPMNLRNRPPLSVRIFIVLKQFALPLAFPVWFCLVAGSVFAQAELKGTPAELALLLTNAPRSVLVTGESEIQVQADRAVLSVQITTTAKELGAALRANEQVRSKFTKLLAGQGIDAGQVKASKFSSTEKHAVFSDKVKSHRVSNLLKVTARNEKEFQVVADAIDSLTEAQYLGVEFERSDSEDLKAKAIAQAIDNANQRKQVFEGKLGLKLTVRGFWDPSGAPPPGPTIQKATNPTRGYGFDWYLGNSLVLGGASDYSDSAVTLRALAQRGESGSSFGELTFRSRVIIEYSAQGK